MQGLKTSRIARLIVLTVCLISMASSVFSGAADVFAQTTQSDTQQAIEVKSSTIEKAESLRSAGEVDAAIKVLETAKKLGEDTLLVNLYLADNYAQKVDQVGPLKLVGLAKKIKMSLERAYVLDWASEEAIGGLIQFHMQAPSIAGGDKKQIPILTEKLMQINPAKGGIYKARVLFDNNDLEGAEKALDKAMIADPSLDTGYMMKSGILAKNKRYDEAIEVLETCAGAVKDAAQCDYQIGRLVQMQGLDNEKGIAAFKRFLAASHDVSPAQKAYAYYRLGTLYEEKGDDAQAKAQYGKALELYDFKKDKDARKAMGQ